MTIESILESRASTHGSFSDNARISQELKRVMHGSPNWSQLTAVQAEAAEMIVHKLARALSGNPNEPDHWADLAGYSTLVVRDIEASKFAGSIAAPIQSENNQAYAFGAQSFTPVRQDTGD